MSGSAKPNYKLKCTRCAIHTHTHKKKSIKGCARGGGGGAFFVCLHTAIDGVPGCRLSALMRGVLGLWGTVGGGKQHFSI